MRDAWPLLTASALGLLAYAAVLARRALPRRCAEYHLADTAGRLLYIGITFDVAARMAQHRRDKWWWPQVDESRTRVVWHRDRVRAETAERRAIRVGAPLYNDRHNLGRGYGPRVAVAQDHRPAVLDAAGGVGRVRSGTRRPTRGATRVLH